MTRRTRPSPTILRAAVLAGCAACGAVGARAENHALIMTIGAYADPRANLPGIDLDAKAARRIALAMGVPAPNITELKDQQLALAGLSKAVGALTARIRQDDKVFIYYSGHGAQRNNTGEGRRCSEGLVAQDVKLYLDRELEQALAALQARASQVVMFNDSCFSGGAAVKGLDPSQLVPKALPPIVPMAAGAAAPPTECGVAVNKSVFTKSFQVVPRAQGPRLLYLAASRDNEVSYASPEGSLATQAWAACLSDPKADKDRSGSLSGEELRACAQARIDANTMGVRQHVSLTGSGDLPVTLTDLAPPPPVAASAASAPAIAALSPAAALKDLRAAADPSIQVPLKAARSSMRIGQDYLDFSVRMPREGHLYVLQVGSDGKTFNLLFPNKLDADNRLPAGEHKFPRANWRIRSGGPAGANHLMAIWSATPRDFRGQMGGDEVFASAPATRAATKTLMVVATGAASGGQGRYGASEVVTVQEVP